jgi:hypothetical protein
MDIETHAIATSSLAINFFPYQFEEVQQHGQDQETDDQAGLRYEVAI